RGIARLHQRQQTLLVQELRSLGAAHRVVGVDVLVENLPALRLREGARVVNLSGDALVFVVAPVLCGALSGVDSGSCHRISFSFEVAYGRSDGISTLPP